MAADNRAMQALHEKLAEFFTNELGKDDVSPSMANAIRQFLKDNGIEAVPTKKNPIGVLARKLPFDEEESGTAEYTQ